MPSLKSPVQHGKNRDNEKASLATRVVNFLLPRNIQRRTFVWAWLSFLAELLIIATGGAVRLTGSGLGCPTWPTCTPESLIPTPEMGIHGIIEFGNRTLTGLVGILAVLVLLAVWRTHRTDLKRLAWVVVIGVIAQAIVGGITVLVKLNPFIVGFHYVASLTLVCVAAAFLYFLYLPEGKRERPVPLWFLILTHLASALLAVTIIFGVLTTGSGPHSGDQNAARNGFDAELWQHIHAWPSYALAAVTVILVTIAAIKRLPAFIWLAALLVLEVVQVLLGIYQARNGLPVLAVGAHMVLAALTAAAMTLSVMALRTPVAETKA